MTAPILILARGNPGRGDDALGTSFADRLEAQLAGNPRFDFLSVSQRQVAHALDLQDRAGVIFVDATADGDSPYSFEAIEAREDDSLATPTLSPEAVLHIFQEVNGGEPPPAWLMSIRGESFEPGSPLSAAASANLDAALQEFQAWLAQIESLSP